MDEKKLRHNHFIGLVSEDGSEWNERIIVDTFVNGDAMAVDSVDEEDYYEERGYDVLHWNHYKPLPQKVTRPMTPVEVVKELYGKAVFNQKGSTYWRTDLTVGMDPSNWEYCLISNLGTDAEEWMPLVKEVEE